MKRSIYYIDGSQSRTCVRTEQTERERQMRLARERLTEEFVELLSIDPEDGTCWTGTVADLVEVAHIAYVQGTVCGGHGTACTFRELVNRACAVLHVKVPRNPRACVYQAARRKGIRSSPYIERYARRLMMRQGPTRQGPTPALPKGRVPDEMTRGQSFLMSDTNR